MVLLGAESLSLLDVNPGLVIWTLVTFLLVVFVLKKFAWDVIIKALDDRANTIQHDIERAAQLKEEAEASLRQYKEQLEKAQDEATSIINEAKSDANNLRDKLMAETNQEIQAKKEQAIKDIELAKSKATEELKEQMVDMVVLVAGKLLEKQMKPEDHTAFVQSELEKLRKLSA